MFTITLELGQQQLEALFDFQLGVVAGYELAEKNNIPIDSEVNTQLLVLAKVIVNQLTPLITSLKGENYIEDCLLQFVEESAHMYDPEKVALIKNNWKQVMNIPPTSKN